MSRHKALASYGPVETEAEARARVVSAICAKPFLDLPGDLEVLADIGETAARGMMRDPSFPPVRQHGRGVTLGRTEPILDYLTGEQRA